MTDDKNAPTRTIHLSIRMRVEKDGEKYIILRHDSDKAPFSFNGTVPHLMCSLPNLHVNQSQYNNLHEKSHHNRHRTFYNTFEECANIIKKYTPEIYHSKIIKLDLNKSGNMRNRKEKIQSNLTETTAEDVTIVQPLAELNNDYIEKDASNYVSLEENTDTNEPSKSKRKINTTEQSEKKQKSDDKEGIVEEIEKIFREKNIEDEHMFTSVNQMNHLKFYKIETHQLANNVIRIIDFNETPQHDSLTDVFMTTLPTINALRAELIQQLRKDQIATINDTEYYIVPSEKLQTLKDNNYSFEKIRDIFLQKFREKLKQFWKYPPTKQHPTIQMTDEMQKEPIFANTEQRKTTAQILLLLNSSRQVQQPSPHSSSGQQPSQHLTPRPVQLLSSVPQSSDQQSSDQQFSPMSVPQLSDQQSVKKAFSAFGDNATIKKILPVNIH